MHEPSFCNVRTKPARKRIRRTLAAVLLGLGLIPPAPAQSDPPAASPPGEKAAFVAPSPRRFFIRMEMGDIDQARRWLDAGLDPDFMADQIGTGLMIAAWHGNLALMDLFVSRGADVNKANLLGEQALLHAAWRGHLAAVEWLLAHGARLEREPMQWTALHYAVFAGHRDVAQALIEGGADINARSPNGSSVLMMAVYEGREELAQMLVGLGADRSVKNDWGDGALEWAMKFNHLNIARVVAPKEEFASAASQPKAHWGEPRRSEFASEELERLLRVRMALEASGLSLDQVDREIATERARVARTSVDRQAIPPRSATLEISARRNAPTDQKATLIYEEKRGKRPAKGKPAKAKRP